MKGILRVGAWLTLFGGLIVGIFTLVLAIRIGSGSAIGLAIGYIFSAFLVWAFFLVVVRMSDQLDELQYYTEEIARRTEPKPDPERKIKSYSVLDRI